MRALFIKNLYIGVRDINHIKYNHHLHKKIIKIIIKDNALRIITIQLYHIIRRSHHGHNVHNKLHPRSIPLPAYPQRHLLDNQAPQLHPNQPMVTSLLPLQHVRQPQLTLHMESQTTIRLYIGRIH